FSVYTLSNLLNSAVGFLLLPLFTHYLNPEDYGILSLLNTTIAIFSIIIMVGADSSLRREFYNFKGSRYAAYFSSSVVTTIIAFALTLLLALIGTKWLVSLAQIPARWFFWSLVISAF